MKYTIDDFESKVVDEPEEDEDDERDNLHCLSLPPTDPTPPPKDILGAGSVPVLHDREVACCGGDFLSRFMLTTLRTP